MNRDQFNRTEMFNTVAVYMQANQALFSGVAALANAVTELDDDIASINAKIRNQQTPITRAAQDKATVRLNLEEKILEVADPISALAHANDDMTLGAQVDLTLSTLDKMTDDALEETGQRVSSLASANLLALGNYGVTNADLTALSALVTQFHNVKSAPRAAIAGRAAETNTLPDVISETTSLLRNQMDKLMTRFKKTQPVFYAGYRSARVIVDRGAPPTAPAKQPAPP